MTAAKKQLHASRLAMLLRCGEQYRRREVKGEIIPPGVAGIVGGTVHQAVAADMRAKMEKKKLLPTEEIKSIARDSLVALWDGGVFFNEKERAEGEKGVKGKALDRAVALAGLHHRVLAPQIEPVHVERPWVLKLEGYPLDLSGKIDLQEADSIRDTKTAAKTPPSGAADKSLQLTVYALAAKFLDQRLPGALYLDHLISAKKTPRVLTVPTTRDEEDLQALLRRVETAIRALEAGVFMPSDPAQWWCDPRYCGYYPSCPYIHGGRKGD